MKYLLNFLGDTPDAPNLADPAFQQLLVDVQSVKGAVKISADAFYESLENIVNELKTSPESIPFQKPVSKREAPDYYDVIKRPMDLSTILRNAKARKYKNKAEFAADLDLIWKNCFEYNSQESHPLRTAARFMKQKADHHLEYLADRTERNKQLQSLLPSATGTASPSLSAIGPAGLGGGSGLAVVLGSRLRDEGLGGDEDAAGESDDAFGEGDAEGDVDREGNDVVDVASQDFRQGGAETRGERGETPSRGKDGRGRGTSVASSSRMNGRMNGINRRSPSAKRPPLTTNFDNVPALLRTPYSIPSLSSLSLAHAGPSFSDKGKARECLYGYPAPAWYPASSTFQDARGDDHGHDQDNGDGDGEDEDDDLEGSWWGKMMDDETLIAGMPAIPKMAPPEPVRRYRPKPPPPVIPPLPNGIASRGGGHHSPPGLSPPPPPSPSPSPSPSTTAKPHLHPKDGPPDKPLSTSVSASVCVSVKAVVRRTINNLNAARQAMHRITEFQRIEAEGGILPPRGLSPTPAEKEKQQEERCEREEFRRMENKAARERRNAGGEVGQEEAVKVMKKCSAGMLAHAGFEGANETALDLFTRVAVDHLDGLGKTFRLLLDGFSHKMTPEEIILHALHENGQVEPRDLEAHLKDDIEREDFKIAEMQRKMRQTFNEVATAPVIQDDMMFADDGEMLLDGNFADELGEDFLGLRELGIDREYGLASLTVPQSLFYGRRKRLANSANGASGKSDLPYPPPPSFIPLAAATLHTHVPALLHAFYAARIEAGLSLNEDDAFEPAHSQIGSLGQILVKGKIGDGKGDGKGKGKKRERGEGEDENGERKRSGKKQPGVGKGNWTRPSKEEKARLADEKNAATGVNKPGTAAVAGDEDAAGEEDDAEGEEE
ncbi:transcriptional activator SPT7 [Cryptococcus neoformans Gb118]|nr:transcriptional activator SPT7 [Cryptococcus neoformans var. grubii MW-RSA36]OXL10318.1 transcriptional activator SPT7 [Cryptococcus neoformans var. grubii Gb118]